MAIGHPLYRAEHELLLKGAAASRKVPAVLLEALSLNESSDSGQAERRQSDRHRLLTYRLSHYRRPIVVSRIVIACSLTRNIVESSLT